MKFLQILSSTSKNGFTENDEEEDDLWSDDNMDHHQPNLT
jgi:hypothetical protein